METLFATNLKCQNCVRQVTPGLDDLSGVESWQVNTDHPDKLLRVTHREPGDIAGVQQIVSAVGFFANVVDEQTEAVGSAQPAESFRFATYKPLGLVFAYVIGLTVYSLWLAGDWGWPRAMSFFMGYFFLAFAFFKLLDVAAFADAFSTYDIVARHSRLYGLIYPFVELTLGIAYLSGRLMLATNVLTAIVMSVGLVGVIGAVRKKQAIQCACLGTAFNLPMSVVTIVENSVMIVMALTMLIISY